VPVVGRAAAARLPAFTSLSDGVSKLPGTDASLYPWPIRGQGHAAQR